MFVRLSVHLFVFVSPISGGPATRPEVAISPPGQALLLLLLLLSSEVTH